MTNTWMESVYETARKHGADPERAWAWELFSDLYLDTELAEKDLKGIAEQLAATHFTIPELVHIYDKEVNPICIWNIFMWEWAGFDPDWLIPRCMKQQSGNPYSEGLKQQFEPPFNFSYCWQEACTLFEDIKKFRSGKQQ